VVLVTGDQHTVEESRRYMPDARAIVVKESFTRFAGHSLHPEVACELIKRGAREVVAGAGSTGPPAISGSVRLDVSLLNADMAALSAWLKGIERTGTRSVAIEGDSHLQVYQAFVGLTYLTRSVADR
jgi:D-amino peptidase